jgi:hypothetical protein
LRSFKSAIAHPNDVSFARKGRSVTQSVQISDLERHPLLRQSAETPLIVSWIPVGGFSLGARERWSFKSSTSTWFTE